MTQAPLTLGDKLAPNAAKTPKFNLGALLLKGLILAVNLALGVIIFALILWWVSAEPNEEIWGILVLLAALIAAAVFINLPRRGKSKHSLLANDHQGFMRDLRLDAKTVIFDGSNIYYFGQENGLNTPPLKEIARQLRAQGYRLVCFFDANIFFTLIEHGHVLERQRHSIPILEDFFGLRADEIYVVPSGVQADGYVLESLAHLPISFAVSNDKYRDYAKVYPTVMKDNMWRKGVVMSNNEIKLLQHRLKDPIRVS